MTDTLRARGPWWELAPYLRNQEAFRTHGALKGVEGDAGYATGKLPTEWIESAQDASYTVYSYGTPIAWFHQGSGWTIPNVHYSVTTSAHQNKVRTIVQEYAE
jgi:hypothetical protein